MTGIGLVSLEVYVIETPAGVFLVDEKANVVEKVLFSRVPHIAAAELKQVQEGFIANDILAALRADFRDRSLVFENEVLAKAAEKTGLQVAVRSNPVFEKFRANLGSDWKGRDKWLEEQSLNMPELSYDRYSNFVRQVTLEIARVGIAAAATKRDLSAVQAVRAIDDLDKTLNLLAGRVREWYGLHFPEMDRIIEKHDTYARLVAELGNRKNFTQEKLTNTGLTKDAADQLAEASKRSMGGEIEETDLAVLRSFCELMQELYKFRGKSETYVGEVLEVVAPNMTAVVGASLSARLISIAGSLNNLAKMPASTLQVLGAEKALFRSLKTGARPPKHGVIFQHTAIHQAPRWQRGKIARALSGKLTIAARVDAFHGDFIGEKLRNDVSKKVDDIKNRYKTPPTPPQQKLQKKRDFGRKR